MKSSIRCARTLWSTGRRFGRASPPPCAAGYLYRYSASIDISDMKNIVLIVLLVAAGWYGYSQYQRRVQVPLELADEVAAPANVRAAPDRRFKCDGRTYCSQMTSCAEATFFLQNCPGTKMDGNNDGIPCEQQWCK